MAQALKEIAGRLGIGLVYKSSFDKANRTSAASARGLGLGEALPIFAEIYGTTHISERHRHRYEVNMRYRNKLEAAGLRFSGLSPDGLLPEIVEIPDHPWFIGVQFHPELKSRPFEPHPLFASFIGAAVEQSRLV